MKFEELDKARKILDLGEEATIEEIKNSYRKLAQKYHPDKFRTKKKKEETQEKFKEISWAYNIIMKYIYSYRYSFRKKDLRSISVDIDKEKQEHMERFFDDWWGNLSI